MSRCAEFIDCARHEELVSPAERAQLPYDLDEGREPGRNVATAGVVEVKPGAGGRPFLQDGPQHPLLNEWCYQGLRHVHQGGAALDRGEADLRLIDDQRSGSIDLESLVATFELPPVDPVVAGPDSHAAVGLKVVGVSGAAEPFEVGRRCHDYPTDVGG